jgi:hypothetical protein
VFTFRKITFLLLNLFFLTGIGFAQGTYPVPGKSDINDPSVSSDERQRRAQEAQRDAMRRQQDIFDRARKSEPAIDLGGKRRIPERTPEEEAEREAKINEAIANSERARKMLLPSPIYFKKFADKLKDQEWHLARIFVEKNCDSGKIAPIEEVVRCENVPPAKGGGSFYSFRFRNNSRGFGNWWDMHFADSKFIVGNETTQGVIARVGDVEPDKIGKLPETRFLSEFKPKKTIAEIKDQAKLLENGLNVDGFTYSNRAQVELNQTYVLRLVAYLLKGERFNHYTFDPYIGRNTGYDALIAFKVRRERK